MKTSIARLLITAALIVPGAVRAQGIPVIDAASLAEWGLQLEGMAAQLTEAKHMVTEAQNAARSLMDPLGAVLNSDALADYKELAASVKQARELAGTIRGIANTGADISRQIQDIYGTDVEAALRGIPAATYQQMMNTTTGTVRSAMTNSGAHLDNLEKEATRLNDLVKQSQSAAGALQAQQAGNQIQAELVQQIQKQRQQQLVQSLADDAELLAKHKKEEADNELSRRFVGGVDLKLDAATIQKLRDM